MQLGNVYFIINGVDFGQEVIHVFLFVISIIIKSLTTD